MPDPWIEPATSRLADERLTSYDTPPRARNGITGKDQMKDDSVPEPAVKKLLDLKSYQVYRQTLENENHSKAEEQPIIVDIQNDLKQSRKKVISKKTRGAYRNYPPEQVQELLDLVIREGLSERKAGAIVGIIERTAQNYVKTYQEDEEKRLPGGRKQRVSWERKLQLHHTNFLCFNMHIRRNFGRSKRGMPAKAVIPANRGITVSIIGAICEKGVIDLTLRKPKAVQKKTNSNKKRKRENGKAEVVEVNVRVGTRSEHFIEFLIGVMDTLDQFDMKGRYLVMDNAAIHKVTEVKDLIASRGYKVVYLPPYSPFLNPIELFWSKVKGGIRRDCLNANDNLSTRIIESAKTVSVDDFKNQYLCFSTLGSHRKKMSGINLNIRSKISIEVNSSGEPHSNESETTRPNKKSRPVNEMPDEKDKVLEGFNKSIGTAIKQHAHSVYKDNFYHKLNNTQKNSISNGFNSILDLTDNDKEKHSQRGLFTEDEWLELNRLWNKQKKWTPINKDIQKELKYIEQLAVADIKKAYCKCLKYQIEHAMTENETCFEVYALLLKILHDKKALLHSSTTEKFTEGDYVINVWSRIFSDVFEDRKNNLICKWGDTVPEESTRYKKISQDFDSSTIGDKIDLRICCLSPGGKVVDLVSVEFAKNSSNDKYFSDHRKVLREVKINIDRFYRSPFMKRRDKRNISGHCIQIARAEGQINQVCLVDNGLYVASRIGSLRLP
ncbi:hypothetical protein G6F35_005370 [Rhizopus arrhizus]|nr:hypothetical protein G6F35_005370 [Rhizopus arrhizus]